MYSSHSVVFVDCVASAKFVETMLLRACDLVVAVYFASVVIVFDVV